MRQDLMGLIRYSQERELPLKPVLGEAAVQEMELTAVTGVLAEAQVETTGTEAQVQPAKVLMEVTHLPVAFPAQVAEAEEQVKWARTALVQLRVMEGTALTGSQ